MSFHDVIFFARRYKNKTEIVSKKSNFVISCDRSRFIRPEKIRKPLVFMMFSGEIERDQWLPAVKYYRKELHLGYCSSPRSASEKVEF